MVPIYHLLTHMGSKGHLSNYYKIKVRSGSEDASRRLIDTYESKLCFPAPQEQLHHRFPISISVITLTF